MKRLAGITAILTIAGAASADLWTYDFGTAASNHTTGISSNFLPQAPSGEDRVRIGTGAGGFYMENPGDVGVGTDTELRIVAPTGTSANKFSIYNYTPSNVFSVGMSLKMTGGSSGEFLLLIGDGAMYYDNNTWAGAQAFTGLRLVYGASDTITASSRSGGSWTSLSGTPFAQNTTYTIEIFGNNSTSALDYDYGGTQTLNANEWDLWINGGLWQEGLSKALLTDDVSIDSIMLYGISSAGNAANLTVDNVWYANELTIIPEPATVGLLAGPGLGILVACMRRRREDEAGA